MLLCFYSFKQMIYYYYYFYLIYLINRVLDSNFGSKNLMEFEYTFASDFIKLRSKI